MLYVNNPNQQKYDSVNHKDENTNMGKYFRYE